jgi:hypothetical protein
MLITSCIGGPFCHNSCVQYGDFLNNFIQSKMLTFMLLKKCGVVVDDVQNHNLTNIWCTTFISRTSITATTDNWLCITAH